MHEIDTTERRAPPSPWRARLTMVIYHAFYLVVALCWAPVLVWRMLGNPSYRRGLRERMGRVARTTGSRPVVWIHGVSVGEVKAAGPLIKALEEQHPELELVISSTTPTGHAQAKKTHPGRRVFFYPLDFGRAPARALARVAPACVLLMELEIWPNFLAAAAARGIPIAVVNGRISARSFRGYRLARGFLPQLELIERFCVQDRAYAQRLLDLGVPEPRIAVTGNLKYDGVRLKDAPRESERLRAWLAADRRAVLVCGSTHADEEQQLATAAARVAKRLGGAVRVVLAPRHPERAAGVLERLASEGLPCVRWSERQERLLTLGDRDVLLVDTIGHLEAFYGAADVAFVGGSLVPHGGQNMLEPAALGKAVVFGPHVANFTTDVQLLLEARAAVQVQDQAGFERELEALLRDPSRCAELGRRAAEVIRVNQGATQRTLGVLAPILRRLGRPPLGRPSGDDEQQAEHHEAQQRQR